MFIRGIGRLDVALVFVWRRSMLLASKRRVAGELRGKTWGSINIYMFTLYPFTFHLSQSLRLFSSHAVAIIPPLSRVEPTCVCSKVRLNLSYATFSRLYITCSGLSLCYLLLVTHRSRFRQGRDIAPSLLSQSSLHLISR